MQKTANDINYYLFLLAGILMLHGCVLMPGHGFSESKKKMSAGNNLGFENIKKGFPANWFLKTRRVINNMSKAGDVVDFDLIIDTTDFKEGNKSLKYVIRKCISTGENMTLYAYYPGFFNEFDAIEGAIYRVSFWVKNNDCEFEVHTSAVRAMGSAPPCETHTVKSKDDITVWKKFSLEQTICSRRQFLRIEVNIKSPGIFQIDGITIEKTN